MALPVIESYSAGAYAVDGASCVVTKPTGLAEGNFMIASAASHRDSSGTIPTITPPAGWSTYTSYDGETFARIYTFYKTADSGDVAASNFTFTSSGGAGSRIIVGIARVSGAVSITGSATGISSSTATPSFSVSLDTTYNDVLVFYQIMGRDPTVGTYSAYTTSGTNPTWTEQMEVTNSAAVDTVFAVATAGITTPRTLTSFGATNSNSLEDHYILVIIVPAIANATGTNALLSVSPALFAPTASAGTTGTNALLEVSPTLFNQSGRATTPTQWTNETKPTATTWTNQDK